MVIMREKMAWLALSNISFYNILDQVPAYKPEDCVLVMFVLFMICSSCTARRFLKVGHFQAVEFAMFLATCCVMY